MDKAHALDALGALAHETRLDVFRLLVQAGPTGLAAGEIAERLEVRQNTMSTNLAALARAGLIVSKRDGRSIRYRADLDGMRSLLAYLMQDCCGGNAAICAPLVDAITGNRHPVKAPATQTTQEGERPMTGRTWNVLFLCTGNSARSILAEAILTREGAGRFRAFSAGSRPTGEVHPFAIELLRKLNHDTAFARSKNWDEFAVDGAPAMDFVFTVCDSAASETCPVWPGQPITAHWGVPDPAAAKGNETEQRLAFADAYRMLANRISLFVNLPVDSLDRLTLQNRLDRIGATTGQPATDDA